VVVVSKAQRRAVSDLLRFTAPMTEGTHGLVRQLLLYGAILHNGVIIAGHENSPLCCPARQRTECIVPISTLHT
jgi:hypothetical protein